MAKTADVLKAIWVDPWFLALPSDGKLIYLWGITNEHSNLAGLYVVAEETIRHETKLSQPRLAKGLEAVYPKMVFYAETGVVCVPSRPKHVRSKTDQIRTSILRAVEACPHPEIQSHYVERYGKSTWLGAELRDLAQSLELNEPHTNLGEVPSQSQGLSLSSSKEGVRGSGGKGKQTDPDSLPVDAAPEFVAIAERVRPILQRTAEARGAKEVAILPLLRAVEQFPKRDHVAVAGNVEHWLLHGNGAKVSAKDIVGRYRRFLESSEDVIKPVSSPNPSKYEGVEKRIQV